MICRNLQNTQMKKQDDSGPGKTRKDNIEKDGIMRPFD